MTTQTARPRGRRPGHDDTKGTIARCALELFDAHGYDGTSLRAIARAADVDPALVHHYFCTKAKLFSSLVAPEYDFVDRFAAAADGPAETVGARVTKQFLELWEQPALRAPLLGFLVSSGRLSRERLLAEFLAREIFCRVASSHGHHNAALRGQLAAASLLGVVTGRHTLQMGALSSATNRSLVEAVGCCIQRLLVEPW